MKLLSFLWKVFYVLFMILCMLTLIVYWIISPLLTKKARRRYIVTVVRIWARVSVLSTGSKVEVTGLENVPDTRQLCIIANHQSFFDIPAMLGWTGVHAGFIAKRELKKIPILSQWIQQLPSVFIDRSNARDAIRSFQESAEVIKAGNPIVIFPEGSRSKCDEIGTFKAGSLKLPLMADATILPVAVSGTWRIYEIDKDIHPRKVKVSVLPPVYPDDPVYHDKAKLPEYLHDQIEAELRKMQAQD